MYLCFMLRFLTLLIFSCCVSVIHAQDDVLPIKGENNSFFSINTTFSIVTDKNKSPLDWGGGIALSYTTNHPFLQKALFIGGELQYTYSSYGRITYSDGNYLGSSTSFINLFPIIQFRPFQENRFGIYGEFLPGLLTIFTSSTYYEYSNSSDDYIGALKKFTSRSTYYIGAGAGIKLFGTFDLKFRYHLSGKVKHLHASQIIDAIRNIEYPYTKAPLNRFELIVSFYINKHLSSVIF